MARRRVVERDGVVTIRVSWLWMANQSLPFFAAFLVGIVGSAWIFGGGGLPLLVCQLPAMAVAARIVRGRLVLRPDEVIIANVLRTHTVPWHAIAQFETATIHTLSKHPQPAGALAVRLRSGQRIVCRGVGGLSGPWVFDIFRAVRRAAEARGVALVTPTRT